MTGEGGGGANVLEISATAVCDFGAAAARASLELSRNSRQAVESLGGVGSFAEVALAE